MKVQETVRMLNLQEWSRQVNECQNSGLSVREWCKENGVGYKNYYWRRAQVREHLLESAERNKTLTVVAPPSDRTDDKTPVFATIPLPQRINSAITVHIGQHIAEVNDGADPDTVENVLRALARI